MSPSDPSVPPDNIHWGLTQYAIFMGHLRPQPPILVYAMPNPRPDEKIVTLALRGMQESPLLVAGLTLHRGVGHPLAHLPRRTYRVKSPGPPRKVEKVFG